MCEPDSICEPRSEQGWSDLTCGTPAPGSGGSCETGVSYSIQIYSESVEVCEKTFRTPEGSKVMMKRWGGMPRRAQYRWNGHA